VPIRVFVADEQSDRPVDPGRIGELAERVLGDRGVRGDAELMVLFVDEQAIASLNERFLGKKGPTDVLSFPIEDGEDLTGPLAPPGTPLGAGTGPGRGPAAPYGDEADRAVAGGDVPLLLGDVVICPEVAHRNAADHIGSYDDEIALLVVHGILHLLGMDHEDEAEAEEMEALEQELLRRHLRPTEPPAEGAAAPARPDETVRSS